MDNLPADMVAEIVSRTPVKTIVYCKCVCRKWRNILSEPYFADLHLSRSSEVFVIHQESSSEYGLALVELDNKSDQHVIHHDPLLKFDLGLDCKNNIYLSGSVNGLICIEDNYNDSAYICNPITQEYICLRNPECTKKSYCGGYYGFGFVESNNQYKVVRFYDDSSGMGSEVYTLGTAMWRDLGHVPFDLSGFDIGIYLKGNLHWLADEDEIICTFDLDREVFQLMAAAPQLLRPRDSYRSLGVLKGCLCICDNAINFDIAIWIMKDYGVEDSWRRLKLVARTDLIHCKIYACGTRPLKVLKDGTVLMYNECLQLFTYHPRHKTLQHLIHPGRGLHTWDALTYVPNFMSLKSFMLEDVTGFTAK